MKKAIKIIIIVALIAGALAAGYFFVLPKISGGSGFDDNVAYVTRIDTLGGDTSFLSNRYSAVIESQQVVNVDADAEKKIKTVYVKEGDSVKKGDKLFEYDVEDMQFQLDQAKLDREQAQSEIKSYNDQLDTLQKEYQNAGRNQRLTLDNQMEQIRLNIKKAEYNKDTQDKTIKKLENSIRNSVVKSSVDGMISSVDDPTAEAYITITSSGDYRVKASISEEHIGDFYVDEDITIRSRTNETMTWSGKVVSIDTAKPITNAGNGFGLETMTKYPVYISIDSTEGLLIGQHVTVEMNSGDEIKQGMWLEEGYIIDADSSPYVWKDNGNGIIEKCSIELGEYDETLGKYEIKSGITLDDFIAYPEDRITEGMETTYSSGENNEADISDDAMLNDMG